MNLLIRPCLAAILALASTVPFAQSHTPPAGLDAAGARDRIDASEKAAVPVTVEADRQQVGRKTDLQAK
ncbi:hypothetical protein [Methylobacterium sp.]|jgi:hypothetical protein|uniref:hypothetical protein n=1 Tax=Methylobacterium sp. TaxID=409 RepID=UPI003C762506